jgi:hypothetical protein
MPTMDVPSLQAVMHRAASSNQVACASAVQFLQRARRLQPTTYTAIKALVSDKHYRWIIVASSFESTTQVLRWLAMQLRLVTETKGSMTKSQAQILAECIEKLARKPRLLESSLLMISPFVGFRNQCLRVQRVYVMRHRITSLDDPVTEHDCVLVSTSHSDVRQMISLDSDAILLSLQQTNMGEDHRLCCGTWDSCVIRVARHRAELVSQSFAMARDALPYDAAAFGGTGGTTETALLFGKECTFDDVYIATVRASYNAKRFVIYHDPLTDDFTAGLQRRQAKPRTFLGDVFATILAGEEQ